MFASLSRARKVGFNQVYSYQTEFSTFAIYFKEVHGWDNAVWSALGQTAGDIIAAGLLTLWKSSSSEMSFGTSSYASFLVHALRKPYHISVLILSWVLLDICMTLPSLPFAFASQILMGSAYVFGQQPLGAVYSAHMLSWLFSVWPIGL